MMELERYVIRPDDYEEECTIDKGNRQSVLIVHPKNDKSKKIAMKVIQNDMEDEDLRKFTSRELLIMTQLNHPCIIKLIGLSLPSKNDQNFRLYSEYIPNKPLIKYLKKEEPIELNATQKTKIIYGIASAMKYLHSIDIAHRDLKPENVLLNSEFEPVLTDFELSRICNDDISMSARMGTPYYMAPELFEDGSSKDNKITKKIDVYSFAVTLLSFFTTNFRYIGAKPKKVMQIGNIIKDGKRLQIPEDTPPFYTNLITECWSLNPDSRPSFDEIVNRFESSDDFLLEGADKEKVNDFINNIKDATIDELDDSLSQSLSGSITKSFKF